MPTSAAGSKALRYRCRPCGTGLPSCLRGFTLIELMVVMALIAIATAGVSLALRDNADSALERDAQRLAAVLEATRAQARASDVRAIWLPREGGFVVQGLPGQQTLQPWLSDQTRALTATPIVLGPEPLIAAQQIALFTAQDPQRRLWVLTDGLRPFMVQRTAPGSGP